MVKCKKVPKSVSNSARILQDDKSTDKQKKEASRKMIEHREKVKH